ncbi:hypothetical protein L1987_30459 [Smallanthus sonchifolius]|uniref:Uncharacterized protein n=1 Tax=Smallanthus sonchifolius TaxID=185202 RepID=A0ACB9I290_9ASTR|nr:hypothetical protein L1987_30459 [Smallanthus sonchifolius]
MRLERPKPRTRENARKRTHLSKKVTFKSIEKGEPSIRAPQDEVNESLGWLTARGTDMKARLDFHTDLATDMSGQINEWEQDLMQNHDRTTTDRCSCNPHPEPSSHRCSTSSVPCQHFHSIVLLDKIPPRRNVRNANNNMGNGFTDLEQIVSQQLIDAFPTLVAQIKEALKNDAENVERNSGTNGEHNDGNEHRKGC